MDDVISFKFTGINEIEKALEAKFGQKKANALMKKAIGSSSNIVSDNLKNDIKAVNDKGYSTGATAEEVTVGKTKIQNYRAVAKIGWNGPEDRYRLIHLEEFGYTRNGKQYRPPQFGMIQNSISKSSKEYEKSVKQELMKDL